MIFGLFKKKMNQNELIFTFLTIVGNELAKGDEITQDSLLNSFDEYLIKSKTLLTNEQIKNIQSAIHMVCLSTSLQDNIYRLHTSADEDAENLFIQIHDEFKDFGLFCS